MTTSAACTDDPAGATGRARLRRIGLLVVPLFAAALLMWVVGGGGGRGAAVAAVVNDDQPVTIQGQLVPLGRQLAGLLVAGSDEEFSWVLTSSADARRGLTNGDYTAVVTVPPSFSDRATAAARSNDAATAAQGVITVTTARDSAVTDAAVARRVVEAATTALNVQVVETYLDNVYLGFTTLHTELGTAVDGAARLAEGTRQADAGAKALAAGAARVGDGSGRLAAGAQQLAAGTGRLRTGARQLSDGLAVVRQQTDGLPTQARQLANGARQVADGNRRLADTVVPVANAALRGLDALPSLETSVDRFDQLVASCPRLLFADFCARLRSTTAAMSTESSQLTQRTGGVRSQIVQLRDGVSTLATGSEQVAVGTEQLAAAAPALVDGLVQASTGADQVADGSAQVDLGARQLAAGAGQLADGSGRLAGGAGALSDGTTELDGGMTTLADGLAGAWAQIPTFTAAERARLAKAVATPALVQAGSTATTRLAGSLVLVVVLWAGALATFAARPPAPPALASRRSTWRLVAAAARPGCLVAAVTGTALGAGMGVYLGLGPGRTLGLVVLAAFVATVFALVNQAFAALLRSAGRAVALVALVVTAVVGVTSTSPSALAWLARLVPTYDAGAGFRAVTMGGGGLLGAVLTLVAWAAVAVAGAAWAIERERTVPSRRFRAAASPGPGWGR